MLEARQVRITAEERHEVVVWSLVEQGGALEQGAGLGLGPVVTLIPSGSLLG